MRHPNIVECRELAALAARRADQAMDPDNKRGFAEVARSWLLLATSAQCIAESRELIAKADELLHSHTDLRGGSPVGSSAALTGELSAPAKGKREAHFELSAF